MKYILVLICLLVSAMSIGQTIEEGTLWRTKGIYDSLGHFIKNAKIQSFLYSSKSNQFQRVITQDKINMQTGETKVFVYRDTLNLVSVDANTYQLNETELLKIHSSDSLTILNNGYLQPYVKLQIKRNEVNLNQFKSKLWGQKLIETVEKVRNDYLTYQQNGNLKIQRFESNFEVESDYKIIDFNGFIILQGIVSAPKVITQLQKDAIHFLQIDYRFETKHGEFIITR